MFLTDLSEDLKVVKGTTDKIAVGLIIYQLYMCQLLK